MRSGTWLPSSSWKPSATSWSVVSVEMVTAGAAVEGGNGLAGLVDDKAHGGDADGEFAVGVGGEGGRCVAAFAIQQGED